MISKLNIIPHILASNITAKRLKVYYLSDLKKFFEWDLKLLIKFWEEEILHCKNTHTHTHTQTPGNKQYTVIQDY